jgi:orotidine-5'-phosphate decarboxylase
VTNPVLAALDTPSLDRALALAAEIRGFVGGFKVGLELLMSEGSEAVSRLADLGLPVLADAKLHDIPNTVEHSAASIARHGARWVTVHAGGGGEMIDAAIRGLEKGAQQAVVGVLVVTVLTSIDQTALEAVGVDRRLEEQVKLLANLASRHGAEGVICAPREVPLIRTVGADLLTVTPGIRLDENAHHDQKRVTDPVTALGLGADYLVVGRSITGHPDPAMAAKRILELINANHEV